MTVREVTPEIDPATLLAGAQFIDAYQSRSRGRPSMPARPLERMFARGPRWIEALLEAAQPGSSRCSA